MLSRGPRRTSPRPPRSSTGLLGGRAALGAELDAGSDLLAALGAELPGGRRAARGGAGRGAAAGRRGLLFFLAGGAVDVLGRLLGGLFPLGLARRGGRRAGAALVGLAPLPGLGDDLLVDLRHHLLQRVVERQPQDLAGV